MPDEALSDEQAKAAWDQEAAQVFGNADAPAADPAPPAADPATPEPQDPAPQPDPTTETVVLTRAQLNDIESRLARLGEIDQLSQRLRKTETHIGGMKTQVESVERRAIEAATAAAKAAGAAAPTDAQIAAARKGGPKWEQFAKEFPEFAEAMEEFVGTQRPSATAPAQPQPHQTPPSAPAPAPAPAASKQPAVDENPEFYELTKARPDWIEVTHSAEMKAWADRQPDAIKRLYQSEFAKDVLTAIEIFERHQATALPKTAAEIQADREARMKQAVNPVRTVPAQARKSDADKTPAEIWAEEKKRVFG